MSLKTKILIKNITRIMILSSILVLWFLIINSFVWAWNESDVKIDKRNNINYKNITISPIANVWVAITMNIWTWLNKQNKIEEVNINNQLFRVEDFYNNEDRIKSSIITKNMIFLKEYYNILKIDFNGILGKSKDKGKTLNNIIRQLEIRLRNANINITNLKKQRDILVTESQIVNSKINDIKKNLETNFSSSNPKKVFENVEVFYSLKYKEVNLQTNIIFLWEFINKYGFLNKKNTILLETLVVNKDIISKDSYIVIPTSGTKVLKDFNLIFSEEEYKQRNTKN
jgi:hypothetical protein